MRTTSTLALLVLTAAGCADQDATDASGPTDVTVDAGVTAEPSSALTPDDELRMQAQLELAPEVDAIEAEAGTDPAFSHVAVDAATRTVIVYRVGGAPATLPAWATRGGARVEFRPAAFSNSDAVKIADQLAAERDALAAAGVTMSSWGPDGEGGSFTVGVEGDPVAARALLLGKFPALAGKLVVQQEHIEAASRTNDTVPYWGGDRLVTYDGIPGSGGWLNCSGGIPVKNAYGTYMITAAHCDCNTGTPWDDLTVETGTFRTMGTFSRAVDRGWDMAYVRATTGNSVFTDTVSNAHYDGGFAFVLSYAHPRVGEQLCVDGSYAKLRCGAKVKGWKYVTFDTCAGTRTMAEWYADQNSGLALVGFGDSGGGVFVLNTTTRSASARGVISAFVPTMSCPDSASRQCGSRVFFPDIVHAIDKYNFRVNF